MPRVTHEESTFTGAGGVRLFCQRWTPQGKPLAVVAVIHGIGEHSTRYLNLVEALTPCGIVVHAFDHRGHGRSPGQRGHIGGWGEFREDVRAFVKRVQTDAPGLPIFLFGHSMGGLIALEFCLRQGPALHGLIVSAPPLGKIRIPAPLLAACRVLNRIWPGVSLKSPLDVDGISREPQIVQRYRDDPLVHSRGTPRLALELIKAAEWVQGNAHALQLPLLLVHGGGDRLTDPRGSRDFIDQVSFPDKGFLLYPGGYHELHNDLGREQVFADLVKWLRHRC